MPRLSDSMEEGTILAWHKEVGERVAVGEEIAEIETDKATMAYEADAAGILLEIVVAEGISAPVGAVIARIGSGNGSERSSPPMAPVPLPDATTQNGRPGRVRASPLARRVARDSGIDLSGLAGSGPGGRIVRRDVEAVGETARAGGPEAAPPAPGVPALPASAAGQPETAKGEVGVEEPTKLQEVVARRMAESKATAPHFYLTTEVDMGAAVAARTRIKTRFSDGEAIAPSFNDMVVKACGIALRKFPRVNGSYRKGRFEHYSRVNVGIAVAAEGVLVVPTVFDVDRKGLREIATDSRALAAKVRSGSITPPELSGATFTVSNLGMLGVRSFEAVISSQQAAILAVGEIAERPIVEDGQIVPAHLMTITVSCDHRIVYGAEGAEFLAAVKELLEEPIALAL